MPVEVPDQPNQARLIGADGKLRGGRAHLHHDYLQRAGGVEVALIDLVPHFDMVGTNLVHSR